MVKSRRRASSSSLPKTLSCRMSRSCGRSCSSSSGLARKVETSMILPPRKKTCASRNRRPISRELRNVSLTWLGCALVATSKSLGRIPSSRSRTHPPTRKAWWPARRSRRTTFTASGSRSSSGISGGALALGETLCASVDNRSVPRLNGRRGSMAARTKRLLASSRRPPHPPASEDVEMDVEDDLVGVAAGVDDGAPTRLVQALFAGDLRRQGEDRAHGASVADLVERGDVLLGDHQDVHRHLRLDVGKRDGTFVLAELLCRDLPCHDLAEDALVHGHLRRASSNPAAASPALRSRCGPAWWRGIRPPRHARRGPGPVRRTGRTAVAPPPASPHRRIPGAFPSAHHRRA